MILLVNAMKSELQVLLLSGALGLVGGLPAQGETKPVPPATPNAANDAAARPWIAKLGSDSYRERLDAERKLRELGSAAVPALRDAAEHGGDTEVQWRARRLLRQIEAGTSPGLTERTRADMQEPEVGGRSGGSGGGAGAGDPSRAMHDQFDRLFERFERDFGLDIPRHRFFTDDFFRDLQDQMQRGGGNSQGMNVQIGPNGVHVEVKERDQDGKVETRVYDAPDLESFQKQYPDVLRQNGFDLQQSPFGNPFGSLRGNLRGQFGPLQRDPNMDDLLTPRVVPFGPRGAAGEAPPVGRRLGVYLRDIPAEVRDYLELPQGAGLMVASVQPDSLAAALGLMPNDIIVRIGDRAVGSPADVQGALGTIKQGDKVDVEFVRKGRHEHATADKTEAAEPAAAESGSSPLQPRNPRAPGAGTIR